MADEKEEKVVEKTKTDAKSQLFLISKIVGALTVIGGALGAIVMGILQVGHFLDEFAQAQTDIASIRSSIASSEDDLQRRLQIQEAILTNLQIAVGSLQAISEYQHAASVPNPPNPGIHDTAATVSTSLSRTEGGGHSRASGRGEDAGVPLSTDQLMGNLPPLPPSGFESATETGSSPDLGMELDRAQVALQRAEILQGSL